MFVVGTATEGRYAMITEPVSRAVLLRLHARLVSAAAGAREAGDHARLFALSVAAREVGVCIEDCGFASCPPEVAAGAARLAELVLEVNHG